MSDQVQRAKGKGAASGAETHAREEESREHAEQQVRAYQAQLQELELKSLLAEERERRRIAVGLHDDLGQNLATARILLDGLAESTASGETIQRVEAIRGLIDQAIRTSRSLTFDLSSPILYELGLEPALRALAEQLARESEVRFYFDTDQQPRNLTVDESIILFRVMRELARNVVKHAGAHTARIAVTTVGDEVHMRIEDDGVGLDDSGSRDAGRAGGFGLWSVREHLRAIGGRLEIESERGAGTRVVVVAPLRRHRET
jgi:signal transduction histidine kinase